MGLDMFGYAHALMQDTNNSDAVTDNAVDDDVWTDRVRQVSRWQVEAHGQAWDFGQSPLVHH